VFGQECSQALHTGKEQALYKFFLEALVDVDACKTFVQPRDPLEVEIKIVLLAIVGIIFYLIFSCHPNMVKLQNIYSSAKNVRKAAQ
jgi:hypothetical protein